MPAASLESQLEQTLRDLPRVGTRIKNRAFRQVWRFEHASRAFYLKFYPRRFTFFAKIKRFFRGSPAMREFLRLQWLQKAAISAPRAIAVLMGFRLDHDGKTTLGDAVLLEAIEPGVLLDEYLNAAEQAAEVVPNRRDLARQVIDLVYKLGKAKLGHNDLHLGNFILRDGKLYLLDAYAVRAGGLRREDVLQLGHSVARYATRTELLRGWRTLGDGGPLPPRLNPISERQWRKFRERVTGDNRYFGRFHPPAAPAIPAGCGDTPAPGAWSGVFFKEFKYPNRWAPASRLAVERKDWESQWPDLLGRIAADALEVLKRSRSGDVLAGEVIIAGRPVEIVLKRPRRRYWYRYVNEIGRGSRARRAWHKAWDLIVRNVPTAWPLLLMEKRSLGYVTDQLIVFEKVPGSILARAPLDTMTPSARDNLFRRTGLILRRIERLGFSHFDAKASNWIVYDDPRRGPTPVLIDVDGIRRRRWDALGIRRLLRSMQEHPQYKPADSFSLCQGYAPAAKLEREPGAAAAPDIQESSGGKPGGGGD